VTRYRFPLVAACGILAAGLGDVGRADQPEGWTPLFNGRDFAGWKFHLKDDKADPMKTFSVKDGLIQCTGRPNGYMRTEKEYGDYALRVQWRWPDAARAGNNGVFVHVNGPDQVWPKSVEAQIQNGAAGDIWLVDGFQLTIDPERRDPRQPRHYLRLGEKWERIPGDPNAKDAKGKQDQFRAVRKPVEKPLGEWNQYEITCQGDTVKLVVNGQFVNEGTKAELTKGKILLQSEGSPIEFRNVEIRMLK
jgi:hypothetical protein